MSGFPQIEVKYLDGNDLLSDVLISSCCDQIDIEEYFYMNHGLYNRCETISIHSPQHAKDLIKAIKQASKLKWTSDE